VLDLQGGRGGLVPLSQVARIDPASGPSNIRRYDLMREVRLTAKTSGRSLGEVIDDFKKQAAAMGLPPGYSIAGGPSLRFAGRMHACVALDGIVVHDPHPSREGLPFGIASYVVIYGA
jgi:multidrug efflux pump subunit AcrB